jgi:hypothetical protein
MNRENRLSTLMAAVANFHQSSCRTPPYNNVVKQKKVGQLEIHTKNHNALNIETNYNNADSITMY